MLKEFRLNNSKLDETEIADENLAFLRAAKDQAVQYPELVTLQDSELQMLSSIGHSLIEIDDIKFNAALALMSDRDSDKALSPAYVENKDCLIRRWFTAKTSPIECIRKFKLDVQNVQQLSKLTLSQIHRIANVDHRLFSLVNDASYYVIVKKTRCPKELSMLGVLHG